MRKFSVYVFRKVLYLIFLLIFITGIDSLKERALSQEAGFFKVKFYPLLNENISNNNDTLQIKSPIGAAVRSLLIPGLGQIYNGKKAKIRDSCTARTILPYNRICNISVQRNTRFRHPGNHDIWVTGEKEQGWFGSP